MMSGKSRFPFTASQWQELEHQALIFKYMVSGIPIPPDLLFTLKRSYLDSAVLPSKLFPHHSQHGNVGWNCFQMGLGRKIDPEPGRCRRTDGKKWRCSKEAFPDSKYCERHMHRGKNRSRKPVEVLKTTGTNSNLSTPSTLTTTLVSSTKNRSNNSLSSLSSLTSEGQNRHLHPSCYLNPHLDHQQPFSVYNHSSSSSRPPGIGLSSQDSNTSLLFDSGSYSNADLSRYVYGLKEEVDEHSFFSEEPSRTHVRDLSMDDTWQLTPLTMSCSSSSSKQRSCSGLQSEHSYLQLQNSTHGYKQHSKQDQHHCDLMRNDVKMERKEATQKTIHFIDEWPVKEKDSWLELDDKSSNSGSVSTTQLSISIPTSSYDFPLFNTCRTHNGD
ncbi:growth-regulating factor 1-like isoform X3 [Humulus lupulus]|uniref:growth-regulating factor 1-like isoform X3 n=1 Tax=Humulus lupulus TaxID=3486 RepID=UPI002B4067A3|nr:growth-regulating factor 1-like isoform X3 [Humulus lupulus]